MTSPPKASATGPYAAIHLDAHNWRHAVKAMTTDRAWSRIARAVGVAVELIR